MRGAQRTTSAGRFGRPRGRRTGVALVTAAAATLACSGPAGAQTPAGPGDLIWGESTSLVSLGAGTTQQNQQAYCCPVISAHGRYVAFQSEASNLVPGDTNHQPDVFVRDRLTNKTTRVSVASDGAQANNQSAAPSISNDGQTVVFISDATNLVPGDTNGLTDVFLHDLSTGETERISLTSTGAQTNGMNGDPLVSGNGRVIAFTSEATNIVPGDTNGLIDVFVRNRRGTVTDRVSVSSAERQGNDIAIGPAISRSGQYVAFVSLSTDLVEQDTNEEPDIFLRDREAGTTERVTVGPGGRQGDGGEVLDTGFPSTVSRTGRYVTFDSTQNNLVRSDTNHNYDAFVRDRQRNRTVLVSRDVNGEQVQHLNFISSSSADARQVMFFSYSDEVVPGDHNLEADLFVRDLRTQETRLVTIGRDGVSNGVNGDGEMSADGRHIAFWSDSTNLVAGDTNGLADVFARDEAGELR